MLSRVGRVMSLAAVAMLVVLLPLSRHWVLLEHKFPGVFYEYTSLSFYVSDVPTLLLIFSAGFWLNWREGDKLELKVFTIPLVLLVLLTAVSSTWAFDLLLTLQMTLRLLILLSTTLTIIRLRPEPRIMQASLALTLVINAAFALMQFWMQDDLGQRWLGEYDLNRYPGGGSILTTGDQYWLRGYGLAPHPNILGGIMVLFTLSLCPAFLQARLRYKPFWLAVLLTGAAGLFTSFSRSAWLGGVIGGLFFLTTIWWRRPWRQVYGRATLVLLLAGGLLLGTLTWGQRALVLARFDPGSSEQETRSINERMGLVEANRALIQLAPLTGVGARNSTIAMLPLINEIPDINPQPVHNMVLLLAAELGPMGAFLWLWLMLAPVGVALYRARQNRLTLWALGLTAGLVAFGIIDLFDFYAWGWMQGRLLRSLLWGLWGAAISSNPHHPEHLPPA